MEIVSLIHIIYWFSVLLFHFISYRKIRGKNISELHVNEASSSVRRRKWSLNSACVQNHTRLPSIFFTRPNGNSPWLKSGFLQNARDTLQEKKKIMDKYVLHKYYYFFQKKFFFLLWLKTFDMYQTKCLTFSYPN